MNGELQLGWFGLPGAGWMMMDGPELLASLAPGGSASGARNRSCGRKAAESSRNGPPGTANHRCSRGRF